MLCTSHHLPTLFKDCKLLLFAVDTVLFHSVLNNFDTSYTLVQGELNLLHVWCRDNLLEVNTGNTKVMCSSAKYFNSTTKPYAFAYGDYDVFCGIGPGGWVRVQGTIGIAEYSIILMPAPYIDLS